MPGSNQSHARGYVLAGLLTDVILMMDLLNRCNPSISWVDSLVGMPCLVANDGVSQSSSNLQGSHLKGVGHIRMTTCSNGVLCKRKVLLPAM